MRAAMLSLSLMTATLIAAPQVLAQTEEKPYCLESQAGARNCIYDSLERCQQMVGVRTIGGRCVMNPARFGTTGQGGMDAPRGGGPHSMDRLPAPAR